MIQIAMRTKEGKVMTHWVEKKPDIKVGAMVRLDKDEELWRIISVWENLVVPRDQLEMNRNWDNNDYGKHNGRILPQ